MSRVTNRFYVEAIDDGSTLHGQLMSTRSLSQAWTGIAAVPDWQQAGNQPTIYVDLMSGTSKVIPDAGGTWYYNNAEILWEDDTPTSVSTDGRFQKVNNYPTAANPTAAIKIIDNLASGTNVNTDSITYNGSYTLGGSPIGFSVSTFVRITSVSSHGIFGLIEFVGSNIVTEKGQKVTAYGRLFDAGGNEITATTSGSPFSTAWKMNNATLGPGTDITIGGTTYHNARQIDEADITDNAILECTFSYVDSSGGSSTPLAFTTYENVDDQTDLEQMYIQYNGGNDTSASLKRGQSITWNLWMGTQDSPTVLSDWTMFYVKLLNSEGSVVLTDITDIPSVVSDDPSSPYYGFRQLSWDGSKASITITYDLVNSATFNRYMTGIVLAEKTAAS